MSPEVRSSSSDLYKQQILAAQDMTGWFPGYLREGEPAQTLPRIAQRRLLRQFGEGSLEAHLDAIRDAFFDLDEAMQVEVALYVCGYPEKALHLFCGKTSRDIQSKLDELFLPPQEVLDAERQLATAAGRAAVIQVASWPEREDEPWPASLIDEDDGESWQVRGLCTQVDPELFFPEKGGAAANKAAKQVCQRCEVREMCLQYALENDEKFGVWGGLSERERRKLLRKRRAS